MDREKETLFDAMIKIAGEKAIEQEVGEYPPEEEHRVDFSPGFQQKMKRLPHKIKAQKQRTKRKALLHITAACVVVLLLIFVSAFAFMPSFRESVIKVVVQWTGVSAYFYTEDKTKTSADGLRPGYIPVEYSETRFTHVETFLSIDYENAEGLTIVYLRYDAKADEVSIDSEHSEYSIGEVNGLKTHIFKTNSKQHHSYITFNDDIYLYVIGSDLPIKDMLLIAESVPIHMQEECAENDCLHSY